jgi:hypothetical protein
MPDFKKNVWHKQLRNPNQLIGPPPANLKRKPLILDLNINLGVSLGT